MKRLLWIGDAGCDSGFARVTHQILAYLRLDWEISVLGVNYRGDPHSYPYDLYPAIVFGCRDFFGVSRLPELLPRINPDLIFIQNDPWNFERYTSVIRQMSSEVPIVGMVAIDGKNCLGSAMNDLALTIFWTKFGQCEALKSGFEGNSVVIPLGIDLDTYSPGDRRKARENLGLPAEFSDVYIVGSVGRNQPRKRIDLTLEYFAEWIRNFQIDNAYLYLHVSPTGDVGYDIIQLSKYYGINKRLIRADPGVWQGSSEQEMADTYRSFDVQITTTHGEGWGLTTMEGMACGIPQIVPDWSALGEWTQNAVWKIPCYICNPRFGPFNPIGGTPDKALTIEALNAFYCDRELGHEYSASGLSLVQQDQFRWSTIGMQILQELRSVSEQTSMAQV